MQRVGRSAAIAALIGSLGLCACQAHAEDSMLGKQIAALKANGSAAKIEAAKALGGMKAAALPAVPALVEAAQDSDAAVKSACNEALKAVTGIEVEKLTTTGSGLQYLDLNAGDGAAAKPGQMVRVHYTGWLTNGKKFDSSRDRQEPFEFGLGQRQVIAGWDEGVAGMKPGQRRLLVIPAKLAYGNRDVGGGLIPAGSTLIFDVELLGSR